MCMCVVAVATYTDVTACRYTYVFLAVQTFYDRSGFHVLLWAGLFFNGIAVWIMDNQLPHQEGGDHLAACAQHETQMVCPEAAVVAFVVLFYLVYDLNNDGARFWVDTIAFMWLMVYTATSLGSLYYVSLYRIDEVVLGTAIGAAMGAIMAAVVTWYVIPNWNTPLMGKFRYYFMVNKRKFRG